MKIKKNLTLISLMLGVMMLVGLTGMVSATGTSCGDGIIQNPNSYGTHEQCDGSALGGATCTSIMGSSYTGTLSCDMSGDDRCTFDTDGCYIPVIYNVDTYQSDYSTLKDQFYLGNTVYGKGSENDGSRELKIEYYFPNGTLAKDCTSNGGSSSSTTCNFVLNSNSPLGTWKIELWQHNPPWDKKDTETFEVLPKCGDGVVNQESEACDDGNTNNNDACSNTCQINTCNLVVDEPEQGGFYDPVTVTWHLEGNACHPLYYTVQYNTDCDTDFGWKNITTNIDPLSNPMSIIWSDLPLGVGQCGEYCIRVNMLGTNCAPGCCSITSNSGEFSLDLAAPEVDLSVGQKNYGDCEDEEEGTCYVSKNTPISLSCTDENPKEDCQSGVKNIEYQYNVDGGTFTEWTNYTGPFEFPQDTNHVLRYRCTDVVGKVDSEEKDFAVDTVAPIFNEKEVTEPKLPGCNFKSPNTQACDWYVNTSTKICLSAYDPAPHPSDNVTIDCEYTWWPTSLQGQFSTKDVVLDDDGCFSYAEDSWHELHCTATDALGNVKDLYEADIVDAFAPTTTLTFEGPYYTNQGSQWIDTVSTVNLTAVDQQPHPVNGVTTYYREGIVADKYCQGTNDIFPGLTGEWTTYTIPFGLAESCHAIEYYSVDALGNAEAIKTEFVFSDHTAPKTIKEVGDPSHKCGGLLEGQCEDGWDWMVTMDTPITISCEDQSPHPSGVQEICYKVILDGKPACESYYTGATYNPENGYYCIKTTGLVQITFGEESEHELDFYCVDNVEKTSAVDSELFKVEGNKITIPLDEKWNLISVPVSLLSSDVKEVFSGISDKVEGVWGYDPTTGWHLYAPNITENDLTTIEPGHGYWVKTTDDAELLVGGSLLSPQTVPPSVDLEKGWNLIGRYGLETSKSVYCSLLSLVDTQQGYPRWSALWGYDSETQKFIGLNTMSLTHPGEGYWVEMDVADSYSPATNCWNWPI